MTSSTNDEQYRIARKAQTFFREAIEYIMDGKSDLFQNHIEHYLLNNNGVTAQDMFTSFQSEGKTLMHITASSGHTSIFDYIVSKVSDVKELINQEDDKGFTPLINAVISENSDLIDKLIKLGADVNAANNDGATAAHFAAGDGSIGRLNLLYASGANFKLSSKAGTLLHWAAGKGHAGTIQYLVEKGIDFNATSESGLPAVLVAAVSCSDGGVSALVDAGADISHVVSGNLTLLHICAENNMIESVKAIIKCDVGLNCCRIPTHDGNLPLHLAAMAGNTAIVQLLLPVTPTTSATNSVFHSINDFSFIMEDGKKRMIDWNLKNSPDSNSSSNSSSDNQSSDGATTPTNRLIESTDPPSSPEAQVEAEEWKVRGNNFYLNKDYHNAVAAYTEAIKRWGDNKLLWSNRSACYLNINQPHNALIDAEICRQLDVNWTKGCYRLAAARLALGMFEDAAVAAFEGCKIDQDNQELKKILQLAVAKGREEHANKSDTTVTTK